MKSLPNVLRVVLVDPPTEFDGRADVEPMLESKRGPKSGARDVGGDVRIKTPYVCKETLEGPDFKRDGAGRLFVQIGWYGTKNGARGRFGKLKVYLDASPNVVWDSEIVVDGRGPDGAPAQGTATVLRASNIDDFLSRGPWSPDFPQT